MRAPLWLCAVLVPAAAAACGGKVVFDGQPAGEGGGASSQSGNGGFGASCAVATPVGPVDGCSGVIGDGVCGLSCTDGASNTYDVECQGSACRCIHNLQVRCTCALDDGAQACATSIDHCCPAPWPG